MNSTVKPMKSSCRPWQRVVAVVTTFFFLSQMVTVAYAGALSASQIKTDMDSSIEFARVASAGYQYDTAPSVYGSVPQGTWDTKRFFKELSETHKELVGGPTFVPIAVGDITTFVPVYVAPKSLGSAFVESRYVRTQAQRLLGKHLINPNSASYSSEYVQLASLYQAGLAYARANNKPFGSVLAVAGEAGPADMVWPEKHIINGETVVVPVVYLTAATVDAQKVDSHVVQFNGNASFGSVTVDDVNIKTGRNTFLTIADDLTIRGGSISSSVTNGELTIVAGGNLTLASGLIQADGDLSIGANNIIAQTLVHRFDYGQGHGDFYGEIASINSITGDVTVRSYNDIVLQGVTIYAGEDIRFGADGNIYVGAIAISSSFNGRENGWQVNRSAVDYLQSSLTAGASIELIANGQIVIDAADIVADSGHIEMLAGLGITIEDELSQFQEYKKGKFGKTKKEVSVYKTVAMRTLLDAGKDIRLHTEFGDITLRATDITSIDGATVTASNGAINLLVTKETDHYSYSSVKKGLFTTTTKSKGHNIEVVVPNTIVGGFTANALNGLNVEYEGDPNLSLDEQVAELSQFEGLEWMADIRANNPDVDWTAVDAKYETWKESSTSLSAAAMALITIVVAVCTAGAAAGIAQAATAASGSSAIGAAAAAGFSAMASTAALAVSNAAVNGDGLDGMLEAGFKSIHSEEALKSAAIAAVTAGALSKLDTAFFEMDAEAVEAANAAADTAKAAGATEAAQQIAFETTLRETAKLSLGQQSLQALTHASVRAGVNSLANGGDFDELLINALAKDAINQLGEAIATEIGIAAKANPPDINQITRYIAHAATGCLTGAMTSSLQEGQVDTGCYSGAGGAVVGEFIGDLYVESKSEDLLSVKDYQEKEMEYVEYLKANGFSNEQIADKLLIERQSYNNSISQLRQQGANLARVGAALGAFFVGSDAKEIFIAADAGENAAENNAVMVLGVYVPATLEAIALWLGIGAAGTWAVSELDELLDSLNISGVDGEFLQTNSSTEIEIFGEELSDRVILDHLQLGEIYIRADGSALVVTEDGYEWSVEDLSATGSDSLNQYSVAAIEDIRDRILTTPMADALFNGEPYIYPITDFDRRIALVVRLMHEADPDQFILPNPVVEDLSNGILPGGEIVDEHWSRYLLFNKTTKDDPPIGFDHFIGGDLNGRGKVSGGHSLLNNDVEIVPGTATQPDSNGVYKATVKIWNANSNEWEIKTANGSMNTMFPVHWTRSEIEYQVTAAWDAWRAEN